MQGRRLADQERKFKERQKAEQQKELTLAERLQIAAKQITAETAREAPQEKREAHREETLEQQAVTPPRPADCLEIAATTIVVNNAREA